MRRPSSTQEAKAADWVIRAALLASAERRLCVISPAGFSETNRAAFRSERFLLKALTRTSDTGRLGWDPTEPDCDKVLGVYDRVEDDAEVRRYLDAHPGYRRLLQEIVPKLRKEFGTMAKLVLRVSSDPESDFRQLSIEVETDRADADEMLDRFDEWWLADDERASADILVDIAFR